MDCSCFLRRNMSNFDEIATPKNDIKLVCNKL